MDAGTLIQTLATSVVAGSIHAMIAVGLALAFGVMKMANFAHGEFYMAGAYVVYVLYALGGWPFPAAVIMAIPIVAAMGIATERLIFWPTRDNVLAGFMASAGLSLILQVLVGQTWGVGLMRSIPTPYMGALDIAGAKIGWQRVLVIPVAALMLTALWFFLYRIKAGKALRACAQDAETARLQGISLHRMSMLAMAISGGSAGLAGAMMAPIQPVTPYMGHAVILTAFIVVVMGGMESIAGAVIAAYILGTVHTVITTVSDAVMAQIVGVLCMALVLIWRPQGLLGKVKA